MLHVHSILSTRFTIFIMWNIWCELAPQVYNFSILGISKTAITARSLLVFFTKGRTDPCGICKQKNCAAICESVHWTWWTIWTISAAPHCDFLLVVCCTSSSFFLEHKHNLGEVTFMTVYKYLPHNMVITYHQTSMCPPQIYNTISMLWWKGYLQNKHFTGKLDEKTVT